MSVETDVLLHIVFFGTCNIFTLKFFDEYKVKKASICSKYNIF